MKRKRKDSQRPRSRIAAHSHNDPRRQDWRPILLSIGLRESEIDRPDGIRPEAISEAGERAGLPLEMIAEIIEAYAPTTKDVGREATTFTRESRVELLARRRAAGVDLCGRDVVRGMLDDHVDHAAEGKQRAEAEKDRARRATFTDHEIEIEREEQEEAANLARFDDLPRRMAQEAWERYERRRTSDPKPSGEANNSATRSDSAKATAA